MNRVDGFVVEDLRPCGDVCAARGRAKAFLAGVEAPVVIRRNAVLMLTAALLVLEGGTRPTPSSDDVLTFILGLKQLGRAHKRLSESPMQFPQFVAAELADLDHGSRRAAIDVCLSAASRNAI